MSGTKLAMGTVAALAVVGLVASKRGSVATGRPVVFLDMDETLVKAKGGDRQQEWMKATAAVARAEAKVKLPGNSPARDRFNAIVSRNRDSYLAFVKASESLTFPDRDSYLLVVRPGIMRELRKLAKHADLYVLSAGTQEYVDRIMAKTGIGALVKGAHSSREWVDLSALSGRPWVLVDDLDFGTQSTEDKMKIILGRQDDFDNEDGEPIEEGLESCLVKVSAFEAKLPDRKPIVGLADIVLNRLAELGAT